MNTYHMKKLQGDKLKEFFLFLSSFFIYTTKVKKILLQYGTGKDHFDVRKQFLTVGPCILYPSAQ